jgi:NAD-dependent dihydropyrimidine dehydrogenase PreA subunit
MAELIYLPNVVTLQLDQEKCVGCGLCLVVCPHTVFSMNNGHARIRDRDACMECGACAQNCPTEAVTVQAGVGCAAAVINSALGRDGSACCCVIEPRNDSGGAAACSSRPGRSTCC